MLTRYLTIARDLVWIATRCVAGIAAMCLIAVAMSGCGKCADLRETNPTNPQPYQIAHVCFTTRAAMLQAVESHTIDRATVTSAKACARSAQPFADGTTCPKESP